MSCVQNEACAALKDNGNELMDLAADDLLPLMTYIIASSTAFLHDPYTSLQYIRELAYRVRYGYASASVSVVECVGSLMNWGHIAVFVATRA